MRKAAIIIYPHLNDCGGDLTKDWYVEYQYMVPGEESKRRERVYKGLCEGTAEERRQRAEQIIQEKTEWFNTGGHLFGNITRVYEDELMYRQEAKLYGAVKRQVITTRTNLNDFLAYMKPQVNDKTYQNYVGKMRAFNAWLENRKLHERHIKFIDREIIIRFVQHLASIGLARQSIDKYTQIIRAFFDFELDRKNIEQNPVYKIPKMGKYVDCAPVPFTGTDRERLKEAMQKSNPWLWLACEIQFYCAIRPGTELRLMRVSWIDWDNRQIRIPNTAAKNNETELVDIPDTLVEDMKRLNLQAFDRHLFVFGKQGMPGAEPLGKNTMRNRFNRYREELGISADRKFYSWKHTGAIELVNAGAQPYEMKEHFCTTQKSLADNPLEFHYC